MPGKEDKVNAILATEKEAFYYLAVAIRHSTSVIKENG